MSQAYRHRVQVVGRRLPRRQYRCPRSRLLPVTLDDDDGVIEIDDAVRVAGWQGDVVLGSVT